MEWLVLVAIVAIVWFWIRRNGRVSDVVSRGTQAPEIKVTVTSASAMRGSDSSSGSMINVGEIVSLGGNNWVLNPKSPIPITLCAANSEVARKLGSMLGSAQHWSENISDVALLIAQHNLRFKEVDEFITKCRIAFHAETDRLTACSTEWAEASEQDRKDLQSEFEIKAIDSLGFSVGRADFACLLVGQQERQTEGDELLGKFGQDSNLYTTYLAALSRSNQVVTVKADDYNRKAWESLAVNGFARRGKEIPLPLLLNGMRLKDINEMLVGAIEKPFGRKAQAIEAAVNLADIEVRLGAHISYREMFQAVAPPGVDTNDLSKSFAYAIALATVVQQTYYTGKNTLAELTERKRDPEIYKGWAITNWEDPLPKCAVPVCKKYAKLPTKRPPFHIGCTCQLEATFE